LSGDTLARSDDDCARMAMVKPGASVLRAMTNLEQAMQIGMIGLGRMGASMVRRLMARGHTCVVHDLRPEAVAALQADGAVGSDSVEAFVATVARPRVIWLMLPAAIVDTALAALAPHLQDGDIVVDGGNSFYRDDVRRARRLRESGVHYVDVGTSGGVAGERRGYCLTIGGDEAIVRHLTPVFSALAPGVGTAARTPGRSGAVVSAEEGFLHCGPSGAGHFVKMVHNGIEYGVMAAYAEGLDILRNANVGQLKQSSDAETTPLRDPEFYRYEMNLAEVTEVWRRGSVIGSWLLDLTAGALLQDPQLEAYDGRVSDSGEGRWTIQAAIDVAVPTPVLSAALYERFASRGNADFANQVLSAMRHAFGGHLEKPAQDAG